MKARHGVLAAAVVCGLVHILAAAGGLSIAASVTKPATTIVILFLLVAGGGGARRRYRRLILIGLIFSLGGDVLLMRSDLFQLGLASFLIAHLLYIGAFSLGTGWRAGDVMLAVPFAAYGTGLFLAMKDGMGPDFGPALAYTVTICAMGWPAAVRCVRRGWDYSGLAALIGAVLFIGSDSMIAWARFVDPFPLHRAAIMSTYYAAQILIACSVPLAGESTGAAETTPAAIAPGASPQREQGRR